MVPEDRTDDPMMSARLFATTHWSVVLRARHLSSPDGQDALEQQVWNLPYRRFEIGGLPAANRRWTADLLAHCKPKRRRSRVRGIAAALHKPRALESPHRPHDSQFFFATCLSEFISNR
jgi:hypothetical protein